MLNRRSISTLLGLVGVAALAPSLAHAQICTLTASGATYTIPATSHYDTTQTSNLTGVGTGDYVFEDGWWFRANAATAEAPFPTPTTTTCAGSAGTITWADVGGGGLFSASNTLTLASAAANTGELILTMSITNLSAANPLTLALYHGVDFDVNGSAGTDSGVLLNANNYIRFTDTTAGAAEYRGHNPPADAFMVRAFGATDVFALLADALVTNLDNTGLPATNIDVTSAFQWNLTIPPSGTQAVSVALNGNAAPATPVELKGFSVQ